MKRGAGLVAVVAILLACAAPARAGTLTVLTTGAGTGDVTSIPPGIECGGVCSATFEDGQLVTLVAAPSLVGSFAGWEGAGCSGTQLCHLSVAGDESVSATFDLGSPRPAFLEGPPPDCRGRYVMLLELLPVDGSAWVHGLTLPLYAGQRASIVSPSRLLGTAVVGRDGHFAAIVPLPRERGRVRLMAWVGGRTSHRFAVWRRSSVLSRRTLGDTVRVTARVEGARGRRPTVTIRREAVCGIPSPVARVPLRPDGTFTVDLPTPGDEPLAIYRAVAPVAGGRSFTLPILLRNGG